MENQADEILMMKVRNGDLTGMSVLFERYNIRLYNYFLRMGLQKDISEDLTQNLFYRMIRYRTSYKEGNSVKPWIYKIARNLYTDHIKEKQRDNSMITITDNYTADVEEDTPGFPEEDFKRLEEALLALPDEQRELIILSRYQGLKYSEVSAIVNQSVPAIKVGVFRAIKKLRTIYFKQV